MFIGALGCNLAWGIIDAVFYLMGGFSAQGRGILQLKALRTLENPSDAYRVIASALPPVLASALSPADLELMRRRLNELPEPPVRPALHADDWLGALGVFLIVFVSTFPVVLPFTFIHEPRLALRISNVVACRDVVSNWIPLWTICWAPPMDNGLTMVLLGGVW